MKPFIEGRVANGPRLRLAACAAGALCLLSLSGCATYYFPANHLMSPEAAGPNRNGTLEIAGVGGGTDLLNKATQPATQPSSSPPNPVLASSYVNPTVGVDVSVNPQLDVGMRFTMYAPPTFHAKYQVAGEPESTAAAGNFAASVALGAGLLMGSGMSYYLVDACVPVGYRLWRRHLFSLTPFFSLAGLSGVNVPTTSRSGLATSSASATGGSANEFGAALGYQYDILGLIIRIEESYAKGSYGANDAGGLFTGMLIAWKI